MILALPFTLSYKCLYFLAHNWSRVMAWLMKVTLQVDYKVEGLENLPKDAGYVVACKHQSAWETIIMFAILPKASFVYKKELGMIPVYGWYNKAFRNIMVDRKAGGAALKRVVAQARARVGQGHQVIIFPQGTRVPVGSFVEQYPYKPAIYGMYKEGLPVYPAALNSGLFWPKRGAKKSGTVTLKFLPAIEPGLSKDGFMSRLQQVIESESDRLCSA